MLTRNKRELRLFLNGNLQFSSADEYRYHEALVHPALSTVARPANVLVLGGGDGLAVREVLKYPLVQTVTLVDLDPAMTKLFSSQEMLVALNDRSLLHNKVRVINADAFTWMRAVRQTFDAIIVDFPDPSNFSIGKLYSTAFYSLLKKHLSPHGVAVVQSTSPFAAPRSFWCVNETLRAVGLHTAAYHNYVPSFGEWGYIMASHGPIQPQPTALPTTLRFLSPQLLPQLFVFPNDMKTDKPIEPNRLNNQVLVTYFEEEWDRYLSL